MSSVLEHISGGGMAIPEVATSYLNGTSQPIDPAADQIAVHFPGTAEAVCQLQQDDPNSVEHAITTARAAFNSGHWSLMAVPEKQAIFRRAAGLIRERAAELALLECVCAGLPYAHLMSRQIPRAADNFECFADYIGVIAGESFDQLPGYQTTVTRHPAGVAALFVPRNAPLALASMHIASSVAFGNTCVLKPSELTPLSILRLASLLEEAGLPPGTVNVVNGRGEVTGAALAASANIDRIAFTGRGSTAQTVMAAAAKNLTGVNLQLGSKSANIIFDDADLDRAVDGALVNAFSNSGQICVAGSRILVQRSVAERFIRQFIERTNALKVGDPFGADTEIGPVSDRAHCERILAAIARAQAEGAALLCGGEGMDIAGGYFIAPTVLQVESNALALCQEEIFGPVASIQIFDEDDEAIAIANDSRFGLVGYGWTGSIGRAQLLQRRLDAGSLWINTTVARDLRAPFGGFKQSGIGRDGPRHAAQFFTEEKSTIVAIGDTPIRKMGLLEH